MNFPFLNAGAGGQLHDANIQDLMELATKAGTERGWFGDDGHEEAFRERARAELVLREQRLHGTLGPGSADLEQTLRELLRRDIREPEGAEPVRPMQSLDSWRWDWRRAVGIALAFLLAGVALTVCTAISRWPLWLALVAGAGLVVLGPWALTGRIKAAGSGLAVVVRRCRRWLAQGRQERNLTRQVREVEEKIRAERLRRVAHEQWVDRHMDLLMGQFHLQQRRAEKAVKIRGRGIVEEGQEALSRDYAKRTDALHHD